MGPLEEAMQAGQSAYAQAGAASRDQQKINLERGQDARQAGLDEINQRLGEQKLAQLKSQFLAEDRLRQAEMMNYAEANEAYGRYAEAARAIPVNDPDRVQKVTDLKLQFMPSIAKHPAIAQKFDALDKADRQSDAWVSHSILMQQLAGLQQDALRYNLGPESLGLLEEVGQGKLPAQDAIGRISSEIAARRDEELQKDRQFELERAGAAARVRAEAASTRDEEYGRWSPNYKPRSAPSNGAAKAEAEAVRDQLSSLAKTEMDLRVNQPDPGDAAAMSRWQAATNRAGEIRRSLLEKLKTPAATPRRADQPAAPSRPAASIPAKTPDPAQVKEIVDLFNAGHLTRETALKELGLSGTPANK